MWPSWISFILGLWLIISALVPGMQGSFSLVAIGLLLTITGFFFIISWEGIISGIIGTWLIIAGFISGFINTHTYLVFGIIISIINLIRISHLHREIETKHKQL